MTLSLLPALAHISLSVCSHSGDKLLVLLPLKEQKGIMDGRSVNYKIGNSSLQIDSNVHRQVERAVSPALAVKDVTATGMKMWILCKMKHLSLKKKHQNDAETRSRS